MAKGFSAASHLRKFAGQKLWLNNKGSKQRSSIRTMQKLATQKCKAAKAQRRAELNSISNKSKIGAD
jgi:hypothetical protein